MLVLTRKRGEEILLDGGKIRIVVASIRDGRVRLGIEAPPGMAIERLEVAKAIEEWGGRQE